MSLKIFFIDDLPTDQWNRLIGNSLYCSPNFVNVCASLNGKGTFVCDLVEGQIKAGICGIMFGGKFMRRFQSMPDSLNGGFYFCDDYNDEQKKKFINNFALWLKSMSVIRADITCPGCVIGSKLFARRKFSSHIIPIKSMNYQVADKKIKEHIRAGNRRGAKVTTFADKSQLAEYMTLAESTYHRHNAPSRYNLDFFERLLALSKMDDRILWLRVESEGRLIGSRICFVENESLRLWQYYSNESFNEFKPGFLLIEYIINYARQLKLDNINMGASPGEPESLEKFKERWGGKKTEVEYYTYFGGIGKLIYKFK